MTITATANTTATMNSAVTMTTTASPPGTSPLTYVPATPAETARQLTTLLGGHGLTRIYASALPSLAVVSAAPGLTVWITARTLTWNCDGHAVTWPAHNLPGAARRLAALTQGTPAPVATGQDA